MFKKNKTRKITFIVVVLLYVLSLTGVAMKFILSEDKPIDLDNLVEPVLAIIVGKKKNFSGKRPNIQWWDAKITVGQTGMELELSNTIPRIKGRKIFSDA